MQRGQLRLVRVAQRAPELDRPPSLPAPAPQVFRDLNQVPHPVALTRLEVLSNYGHEFTCLYRFRVHSAP